MGKDGIYRRGKWLWIRTDPVTGKPISTRTTDREGARLFKKRREREAADPAHAAARSATFEHWSEELLDLKRTTRASATVGFYEEKVGHVLRVGGRELRMAEVVPGFIDGYFKRRREEGAAETTLARELTAIRQVCKLAKRSGQYVGDVSMLSPPGFAPESKECDRVLTPAELVKFMDELEPERAGAIAFFMATACRASEATRAQPEDVDLLEGIVEIRGTKTRLARRELPILELLRALLEVAAPYLPLRPWSNQLRDMKRACERAGIDRVNRNDLRRTVATWLVESGASLELVAKFLGHKSTAMVYKHYGKPRAKAYGAVIEKQIADATKSLHEKLENAKTASGPIAQSVELRIFNPKSPYTEQPESAVFSKETASDTSPDLAGRRGLPYKNVTPETAAPLTVSGDVYPLLGAFAIGADPALAWDALDYPGNGPESALGLTAGGLQ